MRIQIASDLNQDGLCGGQAYAEPLALSPRAQALVLAGNTMTGFSAIDLYRDCVVPVLYVAGAYELGGLCPADYAEKFRKLAMGTSVHLLEMNVKVFDRVRFVGGSMWTWIVGSCDAHGYQKASKPLTWLNRQLETPFGGQTVVVTYAAPSAQETTATSDPLHLPRDDVEEMTSVVKKARYWIHGHCRDSRDYDVGACRVLCNPRGYLLTGSGKQPIYRESQQFCAQLILDTECG
ncbi:hypothetical protein AB4Y37_03180 [Paraburkholderia caribensis]